MGTTKHTKETPTHRSFVCLMVKGHPSYAGQSKVATVRSQMSSGTTSQSA